MTDVPSRADRVAEARRLRADEGWSKRQIAERLGVSTGTLTEWLRGVEPPAWTSRPNAKDDQRARARELRAAGKTYDEIAEELGVSKSSVSLWARDVQSGKVPAPGWSDRARRLRAQRWEEYRAEQRVLREERQESLRSEVEQLSCRDVLLLGAVAYWCEGSKEKPWGRLGYLKFMNTDIKLIRLYLRFVAAAPIPHGDVYFRIHIHETADIPAADRYWQAQLGAGAERFRTPSIKRHRPVTKRHNTNQDYHGCLEVIVQKSKALYWYIEDLVEALGQLVSEPTGLRGDGLRMR